MRPALLSWWQGRGPLPIPTDPSVDRLRARSLREQSAKQFHARFATSRQDDNLILQECARVLCALPPLLCPRISGRTLLNSSCEPSCFAQSFGELNSDHLHQLLHSIGALLQRSLFLAGQFDL